MGKKRIDNLRKWLDFGKKYTVIGNFITYTSDNKIITWDASQKSDLRFPPVQEQTALICMTTKVGSFKGMHQS